MVVKKNQRKCLNLRIQRRLQLWLILRIGGIILLTAIISAVILYGYAHHETINSFYDAHIKIRRLSELLIPVVLAGCSVSLISGIIVAIFLPQKIAGPLYRIEKDFEMIRGGDLTVRVCLRKKDTLLPFAEQLNATILHMDNQMAEIKQLNNNLQSLSDENSDLAPTLASLDELLASIKTTHSGKDNE